MSNNTLRPPRGPLGGGPHARMTPGARPQDFKGTMAKTIRFLRSSLPAILIAFLLAIGGVVLTLNIPKVLGNATDEIMVGLMKQNVYDAIEEVCQASGISPSDYLTMADFLDAVPGGSQMIENIPPQYQDDLLGTSLQSRPGVDWKPSGRSFCCWLASSCFPPCSLSAKLFDERRGPKDLLPAAGSDQPQDEQTASQLL